MRISPMSVLKKRFKTAFPKEPVPPVIISVLFANSDIFLPLCNFSHFFYFVLKTSIFSLSIRPANFALYLLRSETSQLL